MDGGIFLLRKRFHEHPEWFRSDRIVFIDTIFTQLWLAKYNEFNDSASPDGSGRVVPSNSFDLFSGLYPKFMQSKRVWGVDVDEIYTVLNLRDLHWVALLINVHQRHILVWDSIVGCGGPDLLKTHVSKLCVMLGYVLNMLAHEDVKENFPNIPYTWEVAPEADVPQAPSGDCGIYALKYIECHSLGIPFSKDNLDASNVKKIREKLAAEVHDELGERATNPEDIEGLDVYDS